MCASVNEPDYDGAREDQIGWSPKRPPEPAWQGSDLAESAG